MKKLSKLSTSFLLSLVVAFLPQQANAGELSSADATISWDDSTFYYPTSCSSFIFNYTNGPKVNFGNIKVKNKYGDTLGVKMTSGAQGSATMQICSYNAIPGNAPFTVEFEVHQKYSNGGDGSTSVVSTPLVFLQRGSSPTKTVLPQPSVSPITPLPTPSVGEVVYVCVNKKKFTVKRSANKSCSVGWVLKSFVL